MKNRSINNLKGFTTIELMIALVVSTIILGGTVYTYTKQESVLREENAEISLRNFGRLALSELVTEIRQAGYGLPPGNSNLGRAANGVAIANATTLTYWANLTNTVTMLATDVSSGASNLTVEDVTGFNNGDNIVLMDIRHLDNYEMGLINGSPSGNSITLNSGLSNSYEVSDGIAIHRIDTVVYNFDSANKRITRSVNGGTPVPITGNVTNLTFSYFDFNGNPLTTLPLSVTDLGNLRRIEISLTLEDGVQTDIDLAFNTEVNLRNMGS